MTDGSLEPLTFDGKTYKVALMWVHPIHPAVIGFPGVVAELFFSSREAFAKALDRADDSAKDEHLVPTWVPEHFTDWDYIPRDY